jgi:hypothetical protein
MSDISSAADWTEWQQRMRNMLESTYGATISDEALLVIIAQYHSWQSTPTPEGGEG